MYRRLTDLPTFAKLSLAFVLIFAVLATGNLASLNSAGAIRSNVDALNTSILPATSLLATTTPVVNLARSDAHSVVRAATPQMAPDAQDQARKKAADKVVADLDDLQQRVTAFSNLPLTPGSRAMVADYQSAFDGYRKLIEAMNKLSLDPSEDVRNSATDFGTSKVAAAQDTLTHQMDQMMHELSSEADQAGTSALNSYARALQTVIGVLALADSCPSPSRWSSLARSRAHWR